MFPPQARSPSCPFPPPSAPATDGVQYVYAGQAARTAPSRFTLSSKLQASTDEHQIQLAWDSPPEMRAGHNLCHSCNGLEGVRARLQDLRTTGSNTHKDEPMTAAAAHAVHQNVKDHDDMPVTINIHHL